MNLQITNGRVIDPSQQLDAKLDVLIEDGVIARVDKRIKAPDETIAETIDAEGLVVAPGLIDLHTHLREPGQEHKETSPTATRAAVAGVYTAIRPITNTPPPNHNQPPTDIILP